MRAVICLDSFKGSISSLQAGNAVKEAFIEVFPDGEAFVFPLADGGEGTVAALSTGLGGKIVDIEVMGPLGEQVAARYAILSNNVAVVEMASAAGLPLVPEEKRNPMNTTTYGVGEIIKDAIKRGCRRFIVGIGGSATNDGGAGMLSALGFEFFNKHGEKIRLGAKGLENLAFISCENAMPELAECTFKIACDVENPLCGENGCSAIYSPQKGASREDILKMDKWLENFADIAEKVFPKADKYYPGVGAAGGMGFAFLTFTNATLQSGADIVLDEIRLEEYIKDADIVVTGEGRLDSQSAMGKAPIGVARLAKKYGKKVIAFSGCVGDGAEVLNGLGIDAFFPIMRSVVTLDEALDTKNAKRNLKATAHQVFRLINM